MTKNSSATNFTAEIAPTAEDMARALIALAQHDPIAGIIKPKSILAVAEMVLGTGPSRFAALDLKKIKSRLRSAHISFPSMFFDNCDPKLNAEALARVTFEKGKRGKISRSRRRT